MRAETYFPACWNGKDLDSDDHKSHVSFNLPPSLVFPLARRKAPLVCGQMLTRDVL